ncbi:MAG: TRM11 family SAM-dependent methyltransferase [Acidimicrobiales bacterium]
MAAPASASDTCNMDASLIALRRAALDSTYVSLGSRRTASPHEFYRYPARFSPAFARTAIAAFTDLGDFVLDPFVGGGTTLVEARLAGRPALGSDLNPLAVFLSKTKTRPYTSKELAAVRRWAAALPERTSWTAEPPDLREWVAAGYHRNIDEPTLWGVRHVIALALESLQAIDLPAARRLARCAILRAGQWALDMRGEVPPGSELRNSLIAVTDGMLAAAAHYALAVRSVDHTYRTARKPRTTVVEQALPGLASRLAGRIPTPRLILMSPPYPGVYVNYHRWKVRGRRETPAPFWIADRRDGNGIGHYTMGARSDRTFTRYFNHLDAAVADLRKVCGEQTIVVQMVGFHDPVHHLERYLEVMERSGFVEQTFDALATESDGRLWRQVPNRRWWVQDGVRGENTAREVVLVHRLA